LSPVPTPTSLIVFGGDPLVGRILVLLLQSVGYSARFVGEDSFGKPGLHDGVGLLIFLAAGMSPERREAAMSFVKDTPDMARIPIVELVYPFDGKPAGMKNLVRWPCRVEELQRRIEDALLGGARSEEKEVSHG